jgi:hypothetical protein
MTREEYEIAAAATDRWPKGQGDNWLRTPGPDGPEPAILETADLGNSDEVVELLRTDPKLVEYG